MSADESTPRVWVGCLGCYNAGSLVGDWFDATDAPGDMSEWLSLMTTGLHVPLDHYAEQHEELWVFDHENFHGLLTGECSPVEAAEIAEALESVQGNDAFDAWMSTTSMREHGTAAETVAAFEDASYASGESAQDAAYEYLEETAAFEGLPDFWDNYRWHLAGIWLQDMTNGGVVHEVYRDGTTYLFFQ